MILVSKNSPALRWTNPAPFLFLLRAAIFQLFFSREMEKADARSLLSIAFGTLRRCCHSCTRSKGRPRVCCCHRADKNRFENHSETARHVEEENYFSTAFWRRKNRKKKTRTQSKATCWFMARTKKKLKKNKSCKNASVGETRGGKMRKQQQIAPPTTTLSALSSALRLKKFF